MPEHKPTTTGDTGEQINRKHKPLPQEDFAFEMGKRIGFAEARKTLEDPDYSPTYQEEYQRLWHETAKERDKLRHQIAALEEDLDGATALIEELEERVRHLKQIIAGQNPEWKDV